MRNSIGAHVYAEYGLAFSTGDTAYAPDIRAFAPPMSDMNLGE